MKTCIVCEKEFTPHHWNQKNCSDECMRTHRVEYKRKDHLMNREKRLEVSRKWKENNQEKIIKYRIEYRDVQSGKLPKKGRKISSTDQKRRKERENYSPYRQKNTHLRNKFGISIEEYKEMEIIQNGVCAICKQKETKYSNNKVTDLAVDHCHQTGKIRGLLCFSCNSSLGKMKDSIELLQNAIEYLKKNGK